MARWQDTLVIRVVSVLPSLTAFGVHMECLNIYDSDSADEPGAEPARTPTEEALADWNIGRYARRIRASNPSIKSVAVSPLEHRTRPDNVVRLGPQSVRLYEDPANEVEKYNE